MFCTTCAATLPPGAAHCPACGTAVAGAAGLAGQPPMAVAQRSNGKAVAALVCGLGGLVVAPVILSVVAIVLGIMARKECDADPTLGGRGMATAGLVIGIATVVIGLLAIVVLLSS